MRMYTILYCIEQDTSTVDWKYQPGWDAVNRLAVFLLSVEDALTQEQVTKFCKLYEGLHEYDKKKIRWEARHSKDFLTEGDFMLTKKTSKAVPGLETMKR